MKPSEMNQFEWHKKPLGWKVCPQCGCEKVRAGVWHRATTFSENADWGSMWIKKISVCFGTDWSIEAIKY